MRFESVDVANRFYHCKGRNIPAVRKLLTILITLILGANKRHGVQPTYKKGKGFQPLHLIWEHMIVDAIFRGGSKNGNHGNTVVNMVTELVNLIRIEYSKTVTIILRCGSVFFDIKELRGL